MKTTAKQRPESSPQSSYAGFYPVIAPLIMCKGVGDGKATACVMAQAATIDALRKGKTLTEPTDQMECACPILRRMAIRANDTEWWTSDEERTKHLRPLIPLLLDSRTKDKAVVDRRIFHICDQVVRVLTPTRLEWIGLERDRENIAKLRALAPITDKASAEAAREICAGMKKAAYAYADASAYASASADASASASAYAYADASASASASADASASASASAYAYASKKSKKEIAEQRVKYRTAYLQLFREVAAIT